jgi:uncharacterized protein
MQDRGLHDHAGGGFFRYCVDRQWTIPHFEKMLYDQALGLWTYSVAARRFGREDYHRTAAGIIRSLQDSFLEDGLFNAALDADTNHHEGATYLWTPDEIRAALSPEQADAVCRPLTSPRVATSRAGTIWSGAVARGLCLTPE